MAGIILFVLFMIAVCVGIIYAVGVPLRRRVSDEMRPVVTTFMAMLSVVSVAFALVVGYALGRANLDVPDLFSPTANEKEAEYQAHCDGPLAVETPALDAWNHLETLGISLRGGPALGSGETTNGWIGDRVRHTVYRAPDRTWVTVIDENVRNRSTMGDHDMIMTVYVGREAVTGCEVRLSRHGR